MKRLLGALSRRLYLITLLMLLLGALFGYLLPNAAKSVGFLGTIYINLLKLIVVPVLMCEVTLAVYASVRRTPKVLLGTVLLFIAMFVISFCVTSLLVSFIKPGKAFSMPSTDAQWTGELAAPSLAAFLTSMFPSNLLSSMMNNELLPCILFSFAFGIALQKTKSARAIGVIRELDGAFQKLLSYIMLLTPVGVFSLVGVTAANYGPVLIQTALVYILCAWGCCLIVGLLVMLLPVWIFARISPVAYCKRAFRVWLVTLSTCSSAATLPHTIRICNEEFGVPPSITGLVVPLGCTIHMCGGAVSFCLLAMFTCQFSGVSIGLGLFLLMLFIATLINMAAPGIPGGGIVLGATYLSMLGLPLTFIGIYSGVYRLLDMAYTTMNVTGDITANILVSRAVGQRLTNDETHPDEDASTV